MPDALMRLIPFHVSVLLSLLFPSVQHQIYCDPPPSYPPAAGFQPSDCRLVLAHLPSNPPPNAPNTQFPLSLSLPFQPRARIYHGSCEIRLLYYPPFGHALAPVTQTQVLSFREPPLVMELYTAMKGLGEQIVRECAEGSTSSGGQGFGNLRGMQWGVIVTLRSPSALAMWNWMDLSKRLLRGGKPTGSWRGGTQWGIAVFEV